MQVWVEPEVEPARMYYYEIVLPQSETAPEERGCAHETLMELENDLRFLNQSPRADGRRWTGRRLTPPRPVRTANVCRVESLSCLINLALAVAALRHDTDLSAFQPMDIALLQDAAADLTDLARRIAVRRPG